MNESPTITALVKELAYWGSDAAESVSGGPYKKAMIGADARFKAFAIMANRAQEMEIALRAMIDCAESPDFNGAPSNAVLMQAKAALL